MELEETLNENFLKDFKLGKIIIDTTEVLERRRLYGAMHQDDGVAIQFNDMTFILTGLKIRKAALNRYGIIESPLGFVIDVMDTAIEVLDKKSESLFETDSGELIFIYRKRDESDRCFSGLAVKKLYH